ncbi:hypothetical protein HOK021_22890 [Streptomyces hygroscopicus]|nr:hypothetical protein HOK021_22890 [Streptomyces hygroscopicus]
MLGADRRAADDLADQPARPAQDRRLTGAAEDGTVTVGFHRAPLPPCAFADHFRCPFPPPGKPLTVALPDGERNRIVHRSVQGPTEGVSAAPAAVNAAAGAECCGWWGHEERVSGTRHSCGPLALRGWCARNSAQRLSGAR